MLASLIKLFWFPSTKKRKQFVGVAVVVQGVTCSSRGVLGLVQEANMVQSVVVDSEGVFRIVRQARIVQPASLNSTVDFVEG
jgi:hypothetical protein